MIEYACMLPRNAVVDKILLVNHSSHLVITFSSRHSVTPSHTLLRYSVRLYFYHSLGILPCYIIILLLHWWLLLYFLESHLFPLELSDLLQKQS